MDRSDWLIEKRRGLEARLDSLASIYDDHWATIGPTHRFFVEKLVSLCPPGGTILDAACGTGKYWQIILDAGRTIGGTDQSQGMLAQAKGKFPAVPTEKVGLQELPYRQAFDAAMCVDAMEYVFPEDWLLVLKNLHRALKPNGYCYFTVELAEEKDLDNDFAEGQQAGFPVVYGESAPEGRYHYYPQIEQVRKWLQLAGFTLVEERLGGDEYHHFLVQKYG